jgi:uncharacterized protein (TIGR03435 family)
MKRVGQMIEAHGKRLLSAAALAAITVSVLFGLARVTPGRAGSPLQTKTADQQPYEFDVATIKPSQDSNAGYVVGFLTEDSYRARNATFKEIIQDAYGVLGGRDETVFGGPKWLETDRYYINAKIDPATADRLKKLRPDDRRLVQEQMVRALLADRLKLVIHREAKEYAVYALTIAKNGPKLKEAKSGDTYEKGFPDADKFAGPVKAGDIAVVGGGGPGGRTWTFYAFGVSMPNFARRLTIYAGQTVQDRTELKGSYDFTLKYWSTMGRNNPDGSPEAQSAPSASEPAGGPDIFGAIQQQLGLKLTATKGPVDIVVIDHVERPSGN